MRRIKTKKVAKMAEARRLSPELKVARARKLRINKVAKAQKLRTKKVAKARKLRIK